MYWFQRLLALVALFGYSHQQATSPDPCDDTTYAILDEPYRSAKFKIEAPETPLCDLILPEGWYRFNSSAGTTMPTTCQENLQCGTVVPIWMNGTHPKVADGIVEREACANFNSERDHCCERSRNIKVRNCGGFYVYYLYPTPSCPVSYCAGDGEVCPVGKWSENDNQPPCIDAFPIMKDHPELLGPNYDNTSFDFMCQFNFSGGEKPDLQRFEVSWLFDGEEDPNITPDILNITRNESKLDGSKLKGHLNKNIECQVSSYYKGNEAHKSAYLRSNAYYAALEVNPPRLEFNETESEKPVYLTSTVPIICDFQGLECCLNFQLDLDGTKAVIPTSCTYKLCDDDWDYENSSATIEINVIPKQVIVQGTGDSQLLLSFEETETTGGKYLNIFNQVKPNNVQITTKDTKTFTCSATGDPHFTSFDHRMSNLYLWGDFTAVQVPKRNFEVQVRTWPCNKGVVPPVTCICGVTVREGNDLVRIDQCDQQFEGRTTSPKITTPRPLQEGTIVLRSADARQIGVYLRSGAQIRFESSSTLISIYITLPSTDKDSATGICGTNDGNGDNELTYPNGHVGSECDGCRTSTDYRCCTPTSFMEAWRANDTLNRPSLFLTIPDPLNVTTASQYCSCVKDAIVCDGNATVDNKACNRDCSAAPPENDCGPWACNKKRGHRYEDADEPDEAYYDFVRREVTPVDIDFNKPWPTNEADGITEAQARDKCRAAILKSRLSSTVDESTDIFKATLGFCMEDIRFSESTDYLDATTTAFTASSQVSLAKDPANYVTDNTTGKPVMKAEFVQDVCDVSCEEHGHCGEKGGCVCNEGWEGYSCHIKSGKGPVLDKIRSGPMCDIGERPCQKIYTDVFNINLSDKLMCRVQPVDEDGNNIGPAVDTEAFSLSAYRISCALPETSVSHKRYKISASNDGTLFGNQLPLLVFNSLCMNCDETACTAKASACHIESKCYRDGHINEDDSTKMCDISKATDVWSDVPTTTTTTTTTTTIPTTTTTVPTTTTTVPSTSTATTTTTTPTTTAADDASPCLKNGLLDGLNPDPSDCHKFIVCAFGSVNTVKCQAGLWFDIDTKSCQPPHVANCPAMGKP